LALVGAWTVTEADANTGEVLRLAPPRAGGLRLFGSCGMLLGDWRADANGLFLADINGRSAAERTVCPSDSLAEPPWLVGAGAFRMEDGRAVLTDSRGRRLAVLLPDATISPGPDIYPPFTQPPVVDAETRRAFAPAAPVPATLTPAGRDALLGRWRPLEPRRVYGTPFVELRADGTWSGSDGCNGQGGRWAAGPGGALLATSGPSTLIGCTNVAIAQWLAAASRAGLDGDVLVLLDVQGVETGRLRRDR
jgi:hypothetical protein